VKVLRFAVSFVPVVAIESGRVRVTVRAKVRAKVNKGKLKVADYKNCFMPQKPHTKTTLFCIRFCPGGGGSIMHRRRVALEAHTWDLPLLGARALHPYALPHALGCTDCQPSTGKDSEG
jgi:hypothetical protein